MKKKKKNAKKNRKKRKVSEKIQKKEECTMDCCCNPQCFVCWGTVIPPHHLDIVNVISQ
jgi:hypothetical protein